MGVKELYGRTWKFEITLYTLSRREKEYKEVLNLLEEDCGLSVSSTTGTVHEQRRSKGVQTYSFTDYLFQGIVITYPLLHGEGANIFIYRLSVSSDMAEMVSQIRNDVVQTYSFTDYLFQAG